MTDLVPLMSSGTLTLITFSVIAAFIVLGSMSLLRHTRRITAPFEADLTPEGREAQAFENHFVSRRPVEGQPATPAAEVLDDEQPDESAAAHQH